ncbi:MAG: hypothetical protein AABY32_02935 [Nanoarchaeota archaeon]
MKKTPEQIKIAILNVLEEKPFSIQQISKKIDSNWATVREIIKNLEEDNKVKELMSTENIKLYQRITGDTYYNIPITEEQRQKFMFLFSLIINEYKKKRKFPNKTKLAKTAVRVIEEANLDLPTVWYLYGKIPLMICDLSRDYSTNYVPKNEKEIEDLVIKIVPLYEKMNVADLKQDQYSRHKKVLYDIKEKILDKKQTWDKEILKLFNQFLVYCPINPAFPDIFLLTERLVLIINKVAIISNLEEYRLDILMILDSLWKYISTYSLFDSLTQNKQYSNAKEIMKFYLEKPLEIKKEIVEEAISNLESIYLSELNDKKIEIDEDSLEVREVLSDLYE